MTETFLPIPFLGSRGGRCIGLTTLPPSCADCLEIWKPQPPGNLRDCPGLYRGCFTLYIVLKIESLFQSLARHLLPELPQFIVGTMIISLWILETQSVKFSVDLLFSVQNPMKIFCAHSDEAENMLTS